VGYIRIDGSTTSQQRHFFCTKFQTKEDCKVAILSITAANAGLNMAAASIVIFGELFWNPGVGIPFLQFPFLCCCLVGDLDFVVK
jgi:SWI/SNF-related matrix-associated actin-dependent regulator 1 of chromatin subfamily A